MATGDSSGQTEEFDPKIDEKLATIERKQLIRRIIAVIGILSILAAAYLSFRFVGFEFTKLQKQFPTWVNSLNDFVPPDFHYLSNHTLNNDHHGFGAIVQTLTNPGTIWESLVGGNQQNLIRRSADTILIGFVGTVLGFPLALTFGILGSERVVPFPFNFIFRGIMSTIRSIPSLIWILIYIPLYGISPVSAVLAIGTDSIGILGRLYTDELEEIDEGPIEAIRSTGASRSQVVSFGMLSQVSNSFIAWTLYVFEINVRIAIGLGVVGAGGLGQYIDGRIGLFEYSQAAAGLVMVVIIVLSVEMVSTRIRAYLRPSEHDSKGFFESLKSLGDMNKWLGYRLSGGNK